MHSILRAAMTPLKVLIYLNGICRGAKSCRERVHKWTDEENSVLPDSLRLQSTKQSGWHRLRYSLSNIGDWHARLSSFGLTPSQWGLRKFEQYDKREPDFTHTTGWWQIKGAGNEGLS